MYLSRVRLRPNIRETQLYKVLRNRQYGVHQLLWDLFDGEKRQHLFREEVAETQLKETIKRRSESLYYVLSREVPLENDLFQVEAKAFEPKLEQGERLAYKIRVNPVVTRTVGDNRKQHDIVMDAQHQWLATQFDLLGLSSQKGEEKRHKLTKLLDCAQDVHLNQWKVEIANGPFKQQLEQTLGRRDTVRWAMKTNAEQRVLQWWERKACAFGFRLSEYAESPIFQATSYQKHPLPEKKSGASFNSLDLSGELEVLDVDAFTQGLYAGIGRAKAFGCGLMMIRRVS